MASDLKTSPLTSIPRDTTNIVPGHVKWLIDTGQILKTSDGQDVKILELNHQNCGVTLSSWARHFRNHYCLDTEIDFLRNGTPYSRADYLREIKFPDASIPPGPSIRSGDFGEILIADYLEYVLGYWVPRTRYGDKTVRNESTKGCDIIAFKLIDSESESIDDILAIFEAKSQFTGTSCKPRLQDAVDDSLKDILRKAESLNAIKQRLYDKGSLSSAAKVERFQNLVDHPYREVYGAAALFTTELFNEETISNTDTQIHPKKNNLVLMVIKGNNMMSLVHELYRRAADEA